MLISRFLPSVLWYCQGCAQGDVRIFTDCILYIEFQTNKNTPVTSVYCLNSRFGSTNLLLFFILARVGTVIIMQVSPWHYMPNVSLLTTLTILSINSWNTCTYFVYLKSKKKLNYDRLGDLNILGAVRLVHSDLRIYRISCFLLDVTDSWEQLALYGTPLLPLRFYASESDVYRIWRLLYMYILFMHTLYTCNSYLYQA